MIARLTEAAWTVVAALPGSVARGLFAFVAWAAWLRGGKSVKQLEANLARVLPDASRRRLRRVSLQGMRSYMRYYCEVFRLRKLSGEQIDALVRPVGADAIRARLEAGQSCVLALGHLGNWDLAGAWAARHLAPVTTVAERLQPESLYQDFVRTRNAVGISLVPYERGGVTFRSLLTAAKSDDVRLYPLLADRDLGAGGVEVDLFGEAARLAPGPAALAMQAKLPLFATALTCERLTGARRKAARSPWGLVVEFHPETEIPADGSRSERVAKATQAWGAQLAESITAHPEDWHMLQKVFVADLDPERDARRRAEAP